MPDLSKSQRRLMAAAAHTPGGYGGVPQSVGRKFIAADKGRDLSNLPERVTRKADGGAYTKPFRW